MPDESNPGTSSRFQNNADTNAVLVAQLDKQFTNQMNQISTRFEGLMTEREKRILGMAEAVERAIVAERDYVNGQTAIINQRLDGIDRATVVVNEIVTRVPTDVQKEVGHLRELTFEKFASVSIQFQERDTRSERESKDNKVAVDAAFAAQKEAASEQNKSNTLAIGKSETATAESINKLTELFRTSIEGLGDKLDDLKARVAFLESIRVGAAESRTTARSDTTMLVGIVGAVIAAIGVAIAIIVATKG